MARFESQEYGIYFTIPGEFEEGKSLKDYEEFISINIVEGSNIATVGPSSGPPSIGSAGNPGFNVAFSTQRSLADILTHFDACLHPKSRVSLIWYEGEERTKEDYRAFKSLASWNKEPSNSLEWVSELWRSRRDSFMLKDLSPDFLEELNRAEYVSLLCKQDIDKVMLSHFWYNHRIPYKPKQTEFAFNTPLYLKYLFELAYEVTNFEVTEEIDMWIRGKIISNFFKAASLEPETQS